MNLNRNLDDFYNKNKKEIDKSKFNNKLPKIYNFLLKKYKNNPDYNTFKEKLIEQAKYEISCTIKDPPYDTLTNKVPEDSLILNILNKQDSKIKNYEKNINKIMNETFEISEIIDMTSSFDISGIKENILFLDSEIQKNQMQMKEFKISGGDGNIDEYIEKKYQNRSEDGIELNNDIGYLSKTQKEIEIYENIIYILYFLLSSSLGFFYLFKNK